MQRWTDGLYGEPLTQRELDILARAAQGDGNRETGRVLHLSQDTVKTYRQRILGKLGASNTAHAVAIGFRQGLIT